MTVISVIAAAFAVFGRPAFADESTATPAASSQTATTSQRTAWYDTAWGHVGDTWRQGGLDLYVPVYTLHMPFAYTRALLRTYNDYPAGAGVGLGRYNASGNWEGMFAMVFSDSHGRPQYQGGYSWISTWRPVVDDFRVGAGLTGFIMARSDIRRYTPFPGVLPLGSLGYGMFDVQAAYVPGGRNDGNVMLFWVKLSFY
jgi:palmitoyl transferase